MKGVSEIIAIILILMIVIALAALAYTWFSGMFSTMTGSASSAVTSTTGEMATQFTIDSAKYVASGGYTDVTIRNTGTQNINASAGAGYQVSFYIDGSIANSFSGAIPFSCVNCVTSAGASCTSGLTCLILPGGVAEYRVATPPMPTPGSSVVKATIGAGISNSRTIS